MEGNCQVDLNHPDVGRGKAITLSSVSTITHCYISPASGEIYAASADLGEKINIVWGGGSSSRTSGPRKCVALKVRIRNTLSVL